MYGFHQGFDGKTKLIEAARLPLYVGWCVKCLIESRLLDGLQLSIQLSLGRMFSQHILEDVQNKKLQMLQPFIWISVPDVSLVQDGVYGSQTVSSLASTCIMWLVYSRTWWSFDPTGIGDLKLQSSSLHLDTTVWVRRCIRCCLHDHVTWLEKLSNACKTQSVIRLLIKSEMINSPRSTL